VALQLPLMKPSERMADALRSGAYDQSGESSVVILYNANGGSVTLFTQSDTQVRY